MRRVALGKVGSVGSMQGWWRRRGVRRVVLGKVGSVGSMQDWWWRRGSEREGWC